MPARHIDIAFLPRAGRLLAHSRVKAFGANPWKGGVRLQDYELTYILAPTFEEEQLGPAYESISSLVQNLKGEVAETKPWGRRRLAYPIKGFREGNYVEMRFKMDASTTAELERNLRLNEAVIRYLLVRKD
jgi:small subunit ribosomal protein S6